MLSPIPKLIIGSFCISMLILFGWSKLMNAQDREFEYGTFRPTTPGPFTTWTAPLCGKYTLMIQPLYFFNKTRGTFDSKSNYDSLPSGNEKEQHIFQIFSQYGVTDHWEIDAQLNFSRNYAKEGKDSAESSGISDTQLITRFCLLDEKGYLPQTAGFFQVKLPTGKFEDADDDKLGTDLMGTGSTDFTFGFNLTKGFKPLLLHADLLYVISAPCKIDDVKTRYGDKFEYNIATEVVIYEQFNWMIEFNGVLQNDTSVDGHRISDSQLQSLTLGTGFGYSTEKWQILLGYQRTLIGENTDANDSFALTFLVSF